MFQWRIGFVDNDGCGGGGLYGTAGVATNAYCSGLVDTATEGGSLDSILGDRAAWHHYAIVWNETGISQLGGRKVYLYLDGNLVATPYYHDGSPWDSIPRGSRLPFAAFFNITGVSIAVDNLIVWDDVKTDFSDRFNENPIDPVGLSPRTLTFGDQPIGVTSAPKNVTLTNTGNQPLSISNIAITGTNSGDFAETNNCGSTVLPDTPCTLTVTFTPKATGTRSAVLTITDNAAGSPHGVLLTGTGGVPAGTLTPASLTFAAQAVGTTSPAQPATLKNTGSGPLSIICIAVSGDFAQTNNCGSKVNPGASCTLNVTFKPTATGTRSGAVTITDDAAGSPHKLLLTGTERRPTSSHSDTDELYFCGSGGRDHQRRSRRDAEEHGQCNVEDR